MFMSMKKRERSQQRTKEKRLWEKEIVGEKILGEIYGRFNVDIN